MSLDEQESGRRKETRTGEKREFVVGSLKCEGETDVDVEVIEVVEEEVTGESDFLSDEETLENKTDLCVPAPVDGGGREEREGQETQRKSDLEVGGESNVLGGSERNIVGDLALDGGEVSSVMGEGEGDLVMGRGESDSVTGESEGDHLIEREDDETEMAREGSSDKSDSDEGMCC